MTDKKKPTTSTRQPGKGANRQASAGFTDEERAAMREHAQELKAQARRGSRPDRAAGEQDVLAKIAEMPEPDRAMAERLHAIVTATAPELSPRTWYGMPAYANGSKVVCFFQSAAKFKSRYATLGFSDEAHLDSGGLWPTSYALKELTAAEEAEIIALVKQAVS